MKTIVLGDTGMLGGMLVRHLKSRGMKVKGLSSRDLYVEPNTVAHYMDEFDRLFFDKSLFGGERVAHVVNCMGAIKPRFNDEGRLHTNVFLNSVFPHILAKWGERSGVTIYHITTDCVFDGKDGEYTEASEHNPLDVYGKSKSLGEPSNCTVIRTSIIGPEWNGRSCSLIEWVLAQRGDTANGFANHLWNGVTTLELSKCIVKMMKFGYKTPGAVHIFSEDISKLDLLKSMNDAWNLEIDISEVNTPEPCNRTLRTNKTLCSMLGVADQQTMLDELTQYIEADRYA